MFLANEAIMKITLLDTKTMKTVEVNSEISAYQWAENNWSDDCNRMSYFGEKVENEMFEEKEKLHPEMDEHQLNCLCDGSKRFLIIDPEVLNDGDSWYTLREANDSYPEELLDKHLPKHV